jgi:hypothetical protein
MSTTGWINTHWGGVTENNHFGTHEFLDFCEQVGAEPYICGNVGSGTVEEFSDWVEYITLDGKSPMADLRRANGGRVYMPMKAERDLSNKSQRIYAKGGSANIVKMTVSEIKPIWPK